MEKTIISPLLTTDQSKLVSQCISLYFPSLIPSCLFLCRVKSSQSHDSLAQEVFLGLYPDGHLFLLHNVSVSPQYRLTALH